MRDSARFPQKSHFGRIFIVEIDQLLVKLSFYSWNRKFTRILMDFYFLFLGKLHLRSLKNLKKKIWL